MNCGALLPPAPGRLIAVFPTRIESVMELNKVYIKTAKAQEEIQNRTYKLSANLRRLLIMVDGRSTAADMTGRLTMLGDVMAGLVELETGGFIATLAPRVPAPAPAATPEPVSQPAQPAFNLDPAKHVIQSALLSAIGPAAEYWIECVEATATPDQLRIEFDAIRELLPRLLSPSQAEQAWRQMEPVMLSLERWLANSTASANPSPPAPGAPAPSTPAPNALAPDAPASGPAPPEFNLDKAKGVIRFTLLGAMGPTAARRIERIEATTTPEQLRAELDGIHDMLPKVLSKRQAEQTWRQLEPIMLSIDSPSS